MSDYNLSHTFPEYDTLLFDRLSKDDVLSAVKAIPTRASKSELPSRQHPVIVYHHGAQGLSDENHLLAEYFASRGYIVISSNYHWAYPDMGYGGDDSQPNQIAIAKLMCSFARSLTTEEVFILDTVGARK